MLAPLNPNIPEMKNLTFSLQFRRAEIAGSLPEFYLAKVFTQVAYDQEDYYHSVHWLEESVRLFRATGSKWSPENEGTLHDALDHLAFSHFKVGEGSCTNVKELSL